MSHTKRSAVVVSFVAILAVISASALQPLRGQAPGGAPGQGGPGGPGRGAGGPGGPGGPAGPGRGPGGPGGPGAPGGRGGAAAPSNLPATATAVALPTLSEEITGPGPMYDSTTSLPPGKGLAQAKYEAKEYFVSGTANGQPYKTRIVVRKPVNNAQFTGLVLAEAMHGSGAAHMFEFTRSEERRVGKECRSGWALDP